MSSPLYSGLRPQTLRLCFCRTPDLYHFVSLTIEIHKKEHEVFLYKTSLLAHYSNLFLAPNLGILFIIIVIQYSCKYYQIPLPRYLI